MEVAAYLADKAKTLSVVDIIKVPFQLALGEKVGGVLQKVPVYSYAPLFLSPRFSKKRSDDQSETN
jgi:hypothetical protein